MNSTITFSHFSDFHILPARAMVGDEGDLSQNGSETGYNIVKQYISKIEALGGPVFPAVAKAFHHPITTRKFNPEHARRFREIVSTANVFAVLCGHLHQSRFAFDDGVCYVMGTAPLSEIVIRERESSIYDSSGFNILTYRDGTLPVRPVIYSEGKD